VLKKGVRLDLVNCYTQFQDAKLYHTNHYDRDQL
jgi:hypothetical protein